ncbi:MULTISPECIES: recombinase family protein [Rothia]|uniref:recombinase family protein n=1 Tax=Rothia TaxID=32207 RepID=UPI00214BB612|nr:MULTISPECIES: recombinase family protein [Rothia]
MSTAPVGKMMFHIIASLAEMESNLISERTRAGLAAMKARNGGRGAGPGRPGKLTVGQQVMLNT